MRVNAIHMFFERGFHARLYRDVRICIDICHNLVLDLVKKNHRVHTPLVKILWTCESS
jgi:hypothetical protein